MPVNSKSGAISPTFGPLPARGAAGCCAQAASGQTNERRRPIPVRDCLTFGLREGAGAGRCLTSGRAASQPDERIGRWRNPLSRRPPAISLPPSRPGWRPGSTRMRSSVEPSACNSPSASSSGASSKRNGQLCDSRDAPPPADRCGCRVERERRAAGDDRGGASRTETRSTFPSVTVAPGATRNPPPNRGPFDTTMAQNGRHRPGGSSSTWIDARSPR